MKTPAPTVTTGPLPASRRVWHEGSLHLAIRVPMREIDLHPTAGEPPVTVYDSSGPYTDPAATIAIDRGLPRLRDAWIAGRDDTETYAGRHVRPEDNGFAEGARLTPKFPIRHAPRRAHGTRPVTQMAYARAGIVTPEMEFVAIRENMGRKAVKQALARDGEDFGGFLDSLGPRISILPEEACQKTFGKLLLAASSSYIAACADYLYLKRDKLIHLRALNQISCSSRQSV